MLNKIRTFFATQLAREDNQALNHDQRQLATAALLIEVASADNDYDPQEMEALKSVLARKFDLNAHQLQELAELAKSEREDATSLYQFTQLINQDCTPEEKYQLLGAMWEIAYADGNLDKYEEHLIRKVAELLYVPHREFIRAKLEASENSSLTQDRSVDN